MLTILRAPKDDSAPTGPTIGAALIHGALLVSLLGGPHMAIAPMRLPGTASGSHLSITYFPGQTRSVPAPLVARQLPTQRNPAPVPLRIPVQEQKPSVSPSPTPSSHPDAANGNDSLGQGNVNIALAASFPAPKPDLTPLPHGTSGDVVLDIVIDATGKISSITMSRGLGHGIDETVIATVQQWSFHPATRDGQPVPSEQELHFHYEKA